MRLYPRETKHLLASPTWLILHSRACQGPWKGSLVVQPQWMWRKTPCSSQFTTLKCWYCGHILATNSTHYNLLAGEWFYLRPDAGVNVMNMSSAEECKKFMWNHYKDFQQSIVWEIVNIIFNYTQWMQCAPTKLVNNLFICIPQVTQVKCLLFRERYHGINACKCY